MLPRSFENYWKWNTWLLSRPFLHMTNRPTIHQRAGHRGSTTSVHHWGFSAVWTSAGPFPGRERHFSLSLTRNLETIDHSYSELRSSRSSSRSSRTRSGGIGTSSWKPGKRAKVEQLS
eukprot:8666831-Heterocapsa_arctica.AAC.1